MSVYTKTQYFTKTNLINFIANVGEYVSNQHTRKLEKCFWKPKINHFLSLGSSHNVTADYSTKIELSSEIENFQTIQAIYLRDT